MNIELIGVVPNDANNHKNKTNVHKYYLVKEQKFFAMLMLYSFTYS